MTRIIRRVAVAIAVIALSTFTAQGALAAGTRSLPANNVLYAIDDNNTIGTLNTVDVLSGTPTVVGNRGSASGFTDNNQGAYDPTSGKGYWIGYGNSAYELVQVDLTSGNGTSKGRFTDGTNFVDINAVAISSAGVAYGADQNYLYSVNLTNAHVTKISTNTLGASILAFAFNPADSTFYAIGSSGANNATLYSVDVAAGTLTSVLANASFPAIEPNKKRVYAMGFDSDGKLWGLNANNKLFSVTSVADFATSVELVGAVNPAIPYSMFIKYAVASSSNGGGSGSGSTSTAGLANTGANSARDIILGAAAGLAIAGGIIVVARTRGRRSGN